MTLECSECERDLRVGHAPDCSRAPRKADRTRKTVPDGLDAALRSGRYTAAQIAERFDRSRQWVARRAITLGLSVPRSVRADLWTAAEDAVLTATEGASLQTVRRRLSRLGFPRTESAIRTRRKTLHLSNRTEFDRAHPLVHWMDALGVGQSTIELWINTRYDPLPSKRDGANRLIHEDDFRAWIVRNPSRLRLGQIPPASYPWFLEMLTGIAPSAEY